MSDRLLVAGSIVGHETADAVLISDGLISAVGSAADLDRGNLPVDRYEGVIAPALCDAHLHPVGYAAVLHRPTLMHAASFGEICDILADAAAGVRPVPP